MPNSPVKREPTLIQTFIPVTILITLLASSVYLFGGDSSYGPNQIALILSAGIGIIIGMRNGFSWKELEEGIVHSISLSMGAVLILLVVGSLIGTWILSGIVPTMIYYGLEILSPTFFYPLTAIICAIVSLATGSSWTTASTIGIALIGIATALELNLAITAGAIISGAYFGDKLSPLSDTTNLAPAVAGTDLITHIRHMLWTTLPSMAVALILYLIIGLFTIKSGELVQLKPFLDAINGSFNVHWYLLIPPALVIFMVIKKVPAMPALLIGALLGGIFAVLFQQETVLKYVNEPALSKPVALLKGMWMALFTEYRAETGHAALDQLLSRGGMSSMLNTIWLIVSAMMFGGVMEKTGILKKIAGIVLRFATSTGGLVFATLGTCAGINVVAGDQYISIVIPGRMYRAEFARRGLHPKNLSRCLEDSGTLTSPLIPWNTCGAFMAAALGVPTYLYMGFAFLNLLNPPISVFYGYTGFTMDKLKEAKDDSVAEDLQTA